jgi:hypothetical protein
MGHISTPTNAPFLMMIPFENVSGVNANLRDETAVRDDRRVPEDI